eukprot:COSAG01_NODE_1023_length_12063_cov_25.977432_1_plen_214_part_10
MNCTTGKPTLIDLDLQTLPVMSEGQTAKNHGAVQQDRPKPRSLQPHHPTQVGVAALLPRAAGGHTRATRRRTSLVHPIGVGMREDAGTPRLRDGADISTLCDTTPSGCHPLAPLRLAESHAHCGAVAVHRTACRCPPGCGLAVNRVARPRQIHRVRFTASPRRGSRFELPSIDRRLGYSRSITTTRQQVPLHRVPPRWYVRVKIRTATHPPAPP